MDGRLVLIAMLGGNRTPEPVDLLPIMLRRITVTGSTMRPRTTAQKAALAAELRAQVWPVLERTRQVPPIFAVFPLAEASRAHALMESSAHVGKILLHVA
jgi:NADPH2:quinone reductase